MGHEVFISYSSNDKAIADAVCVRLEQAGLRCWIAPRDIVPGQEWGSAIVEAIRGARVFVLVFSDHANRSPQVIREVERAVNQGLVIIPFRIEDVPPSKSLEYFISASHWLEALTRPIDRHLDLLAEIVGQRPAAAPAPPPPSPATSRAPASAKRNGAVAAVVAAVIAAFTASGWIYFQGEVGEPNLPPAQQAVPERLRMKVHIPDRRPDPPVSLFDFDAVDVPRELAGQPIASALPYLQQAEVRTQVTSIVPVGAQLVFINSVNFRNSLRPVRNLLFLDQYSGSGAEHPSPASFSLEFGEPLARISLRLPPRPEGYPSPQLVVRAFDQNQRQVGRIDRPYTTAAAPTRTLTLRSSGRRGITRVTIDEDGSQWPYLFDLPILAIEAITVQRMEPPSGP